MPDSGIVISYNLLPERLDPTSIAAEYLIVIWSALSANYKRAISTATPCSLNQLYTKGRTARGWIVELRSTKEVMVIFRSRAHDKLLVDWKTADFNLIGELPILEDSGLKLMRKKPVSKQKEINK